MAFSSSQYQELIINELSLTGITTVENLVPTWWEMFSSTKTDAITYLHVKRAAIISLMGIKYGFYDVQIGFDVLKKSQVFTHLKFLLEQIDKDIAAQDSEYSGKEMRCTKMYSSMPSMGGVAFSEVERLVYGNNVV